LESWKGHFKQLESKKGIFAGAKREIVNITLGRKCLSSKRRVNIEGERRDRTQDTASGEICREWFEEKGSLRRAQEGCVRRGSRGRSLLDAQGKS